MESLANAHDTHMLRRGAQTWNAWRSANPHVVPELNDLDLSDGCRQFGPLQGGPVNLCRAELCRVALEHATLVEADLIAAVLVEADLSHARLQQADLRGADLTNAILDHTDLEHAKLAGATLHGSRLRHARNLTQAQIEVAYGHRTTTLPLNLIFPRRWLTDEEGRSSQLERRTGAASAGSIADATAQLGVGRNASLRETRAAHLRLLKDLHPVAGSDDPVAGERLKALNRAYQDLKGLERRSASRRAETGFFGRRSVLLAASVLTSTLLVLVAVGGLYRTGFFGHGSSHAIVAEAQTKRVVPVVETVDPSTVKAADDAAWAEAEREGTSASLRRYLENYTAGWHASKTVERLAIVTASEAAMSKGSDWRERSAMGEARTTLRRYLDLYPNGQLAAEVRSKLAVINSAEALVLADDAAWSAAQRTGTKAALRQYLDVYPNGMNTTRARDGLAAIDTAEAKQRGDSTALDVAKPVDGPNTAAAHQTNAAIEADEAQQRADTAAWAATKQTGTKVALLQYLDAHPQGAYAVEARQALAAIEASEARQRADDAAWSSAKQANTKEAVRLYLNAYPDGGNAASVPQLLASVTAAEEKMGRDDAAWSKARRQNTRASLSAYLAAHPNGRHVERARARIANLKRPKAKTPGRYTSSGPRDNPGSGLPFSYGMPQPDEYPVGSAAWWRSRQAIGG